MSSQHTNDNVSPRKRSPRKPIRWPGKKTWNGGKKQKSLPNPGAQKTLHHWFNKQSEKSETTESLQHKGSQGEISLVTDSSDEESVPKDGSKKLKVARKLFPPSLSVESSQGQSQNEQTQDSRAPPAPTPESTMIQQGVVISPLKEPHIDFHRDDTDDIMASLPEPFLEKQRIWTPEADTYEKLLKKARQSPLLSEDDLQLFEDFEKLGRQTQDICLRLYQRKHKWILRSKITYNLRDIDESLAEAVAKGFLVDKSKLTNLDELLKLLPLKDVLILGRKFCDFKISTKSAAIKALSAHAGRRDVLFGAERVRQSILKSGQELLEQCYLIVPSFAESVTRVLILYSLGSHFDTFSSAADRNDHGCCHIYTIGQYLRGSFTFPEHKTQNPFEEIFKSADSFRLYSEARKRLFQLLRLVESNNYDDAMTKFEEHFDWFISRYSPEKFNEDVIWPQFLHRFTFSYCFLKYLMIGAQVCEHQKKYDEAVDLYFTVLSQTKFLHNRRGLFWNRLLLDVDVHLKKPHNSLVLAHIALQDSIFTQQKYDIFTRAKRLAKRFKLKTSLPEFPMAVEAPVEIISGTLMQKTIIGRKNVFASVDNSGERVVGPEAVAIKHYLNNGFTKGVHGETPSMLMLFALINWDIIFDPPSEPSPEEPKIAAVALTECGELEIIKKLFTIDLETETVRTSKRKRGTKKLENGFRPVVPLEHNSRYYKPVEFPSEEPLSNVQDLRKTVYVSDFQSGPLDIGYPEFYLNRKQAVDEHLEVLSQMSSAEFIDLALKNYEQHVGKLNPFFSWEVLTKEEIRTLLLCIPIDVLVGVFRQLLVDFRFYRSGFPDVIMWNESLRVWKVIEVKGPGDTLSTKQRYWMHLLRSLGVDCVTCRVESVHKRKIRPDNGD